MMGKATIQLETGFAPGIRDPVVPFNGAGAGDFKEAFSASQADLSPEAV